MLLEVGVIKKQGWPKCHRCLLFLLIFSILMKCMALNLLYVHRISSRVIKLCVCVYNFL